MKEIKLIVSEIDGVLTDGTSAVDNMGNILFKNIFLADFEAINKIKSNYIFVFMSSDNYVNYNLLQKKNIPFYWAKNDKRETLLSILRHYNITVDDVLYIGSKLSDISCMTLVPTSFCTNKSVKDFKTFDTPAGYGIITELYIKYFMHLI